MFSIRCILTLQNFIMQEDLFIDFMLWTLPPRQQYFIPNSSKLHMSFKWALLTSKTLNLAFITLEYICETCFFCGSRNFDVWLKYVNNVMLVLTSFQVNPINIINSLVDYVKHIKTFGVTSSHNNLYTRVPNISCNSRK